MNKNDELDKAAINRIANLKRLSFRLIIPIDSTNVHETAYKRRGIDLIYIPHSSVRVAKGFDDSI